MQSIFSLNVALSRMGRLSLAAQKAVAGISELHEFLAQNKFTDLESEVWFEIYGSKKLTSASVATSLVSRKLDEKQIAFVLKKERRGSVIEALLLHNRLTEEQIAGLLVNKYVKQVATQTLCRQGFSHDDSFDRELRLSVAKSSGLGNWAEFLAWDSSTSLQEASELFLSFEQERWLPKDSKGVFGRLLRQFPELAKICVAPEAASALLQLACGSTVLRDPSDQLQAIASAGTSDTSHFPLLALVNSPYATKEAMEALGKLGSFSPSADSIRQSLERREQKSRGPLASDIASVSDPDTLSWLVTRALPFLSRDGRSSPAKVFELEELARNSNLTLDQARKVVETLSSDHDVAAALSPQEISNSLETQYARFSDLTRLPVYDNSEVRTYEVRADSLFYRQTDTPDLHMHAAAVERGSKVLVSSVDTYLRCESLCFLESRDFSDTQWRMLLEMAPMMSSVTVEELVQVVSSY